MECVICLDPLFKSTEELVTLRCGHLFHNRCLIQGLEKSPACPNCRKATSKEQIIKLYLPFDIDVAEAVGECKECVSNRKQLEELLEQSNRWTLEHSKLMDSELLVREWAQHLESRNEELIEKIEKLEKLTKEQQLHLEGHQNEKEELMAQIDALSKQNEELKQENRVLVDIYREQISGEQADSADQAILDAHSGVGEIVKTLTEEVESLRDRISNLTDEQPLQVDCHMNEKDLIAQIDALREELKVISSGSLCANNSEPKPDDFVPQDCEQNNDIMVTPPKISVESIEEVLARWANEKTKRGRRNRNDLDISGDMIPVRESDSDSDQKNPIKSPVGSSPPRCGARFFFSGSNARKQISILQPSYGK